MRQLSLHLAENLAELDARFGASADYYAKEIMIYHCWGCIVLFDGMASLDSLWELLLDAASRQALQQPCPCTGQEVFEHILHGSASPAESTPVEDLPDLVKRLTAGMAVLLLDGCAKGIAFFGAGPQVPLGGRAGRRGQPARVAGRLCRPAAGEPEPAAPSGPHR